MEPVSNTTLNILITVNAATLITIIIASVKVIHFLDEIKFKTDFLWADYERRIKVMRGEKISD